MLVYRGGTSLSAFNNETNCFEMSVTVEPILAFARHKKPDVLYVVYKSSPNNIRTVKMADCGRFKSNNCDRRSNIACEWFSGNTIIYSYKKRSDLRTH